jgi:spermidine synthase
MIPWIVIGTTQIPGNGGELKLSQRDKEFSIRLSGRRGELMNSRVHGSEEALAELGCSAIGSKEDAQVLIGGLGMGFTLAAALRSVAATAVVTVAELVPDVVDWNRGPLGDCAGHPLNDKRTRVHVGDVAELLTVSQQYDAILLDVDNGPEGLTHNDNNWLYSHDGLDAAFASLRSGGVLAVWSAGPDQLFTIRLKKAGYRVQMRTVRARPGKGSHHTIWLAQKP